MSTIQFPAMDEADRKISEILLQLEDIKGELSELSDEYDEMETNDDAEKFDLLTCALESIDDAIDTLNDALM